MDPSWNGGIFLTLEKSWQLVFGVRAGFWKSQAAWDSQPRRPPPCHGGGWDDDIFVEPRIVKLVADVRAGEKNMGKEWMGEAESGWER